MQALQYLKDLSAGGAQCQMTSYDCIIKIFHHYICLKMAYETQKWEEKMCVLIYLTSK